MVTTLVILGLLCVVAAVIGGGIKLFGGEVEKFSSIARQVLLFAVGIALFVAAWWLTDNSKFRVVEASVSWDYANTTSGTCGTEPYTLLIRTAGKGGQVTYRLLVNNRPQEDVTIKTPDPVTYPITDKVDIADAAEDETEQVSLAVEILSPNPFNSSVDTARLDCKSVLSKDGSSDGSEDLAAESQTFLDAYSRDLAEFGRGAHEVTGRYYHYPLKWYRVPKEFADESKFVAYVEDGQRRASSAPKKASPCTYSPAEVISAAAADDGTINVTTKIDWSKTDGSDEGRTLVYYKLVKQDNDDLKYQILSAAQDRYDQEC